MMRKTVLALATAATLAAIVPGSASARPWGGYGIGLGFGLFGTALASAALAAPAADCYRVYRRVHVYGVGTVLRRVTICE